jgi:hypothetical protein
VFWLFANWLKASLFSPSIRTVINLSRAIIVYPLVYPSIHRIANCLVIV